MAARVQHVAAIVGDKTMCDLDKRIEQWRTDLAGSEVLGSSDIDELENHLREEIARLKASGLSQAEAFLVARHRLGDADRLAEEFAKINPSVVWRKRLFWAAAGLFGYIMATYIAKCASAGFVVLAWFAGVKGYTLGVVEMVTQVLAFLAVIFVLYEIGRRKAGQSQLLGKVADKPWGKFVLFATIVVTLAAVLGTKILIPATVARVSIREWGQMAMFRAFTEFVWIISVPLILLTVVIYLRPSKTRRATA